MDYYHLEILPFGKRHRVPKGGNLLQVIRESGIPLASPCSGHGKCGKCRITLPKGSFEKNQPNEIEKEHIHPGDLSRGVRLACQTTLTGDMTIHVPLESMVRDIILGTMGPEITVRPTPAIKKQYSVMSGPSLEDLKPDSERLTESLIDHGPSPLRISPVVLAHLPDILRNSGWRVTSTVLNNQEIIDVEAGDCRGECYGLAIDLGSTKIGCSLVSLTTGKSLLVVGDTNPQIPYGEDVISRIDYAAKGNKEKSLLQKSVIKKINELIHRICKTTNIDSRHIYETTLVCNSAMHHLFMGISPNFLSEAPYVPAVKGPIDIKPKELGLNTNSEGNIHLLPIVAGFVGSDCLAGILATGLYKEQEMCLLLDIGTNTEVVLGNRERMVTCSCASGPAFEGGHIQNGMKASEGAIACVSIETNKKEIYTQTINDADPVGFCGSGIIDCIAEMHRAKIINDQGLFVIDSGFPSVRQSKEGEWELVIAGGGKNRREIKITQQDVSEIQLAKAAILSGISILMKELEITADQIGKVYIAGAFGTTINPVNAVRIGMIPGIPQERIEGVGNTAISGAHMALISSRIRKKSLQISEQLEYIELTAHSDFQTFFIESLKFPKEMSK